MAREAEEYSREKVLEEARAAVEEASRESTGRRKKRKEKREREAAKAQEERKIEEALAQGVNPEELDAIKVSQGVTVQELAEALDVPANDIIKRLFLLGTPLTMTQSMSDDLVELVADDLGRQIKIITPRRRIPSRSTTIPPTLSRAPRSSPSWATSTTARRVSSTLSVTPALLPARRAALRRPSALRRS